MRVVAVLTSIAASLLLATCGNSQAPAGPDEDGGPCRSEVASAAKKFFVDIVKSSGGTPQAHPDTCRVFAGTELTLRSAEGETAAFSVRFKGQSAAGANAPRQVHSQGDRRQRIRFTAANSAGRYEYDLIVDGNAVDPAVIIEPR